MGGAGQQEVSGEGQQHQVDAEDTGREMGNQRHCPTLTTSLPAGSTSTPRCPKTWWAHTRPGRTAWWPCL